MNRDYDVIIVGSGFGGSVSALRLSEKGYNVLVIEKGRRWTADDYPATNWNLRKSVWMPELGMRGILKLSFFRHITILSGVGVGGGSLVYANTLPVPKEEFFHTGSWAGLQDWAKVLEPHYATAKKMLGATRFPAETEPDRVLREIAKDIGREEHFHFTDVGVFFGDEPGKEVDDPFFEGKGPKRTGCIHCGACMTGCKHGAKNTLDKNYLYLAEQLGTTVLPDTLVEAVRKREGGYLVETRSWKWFGRNRQQFFAPKVVLAGGVLGTVDLLLKMKDDPDGLPDLSDRVGDFVRTNNESIIAVVGNEGDADLSEGVAITSILHTDDHSHVEPVRYGKGSSMMRILGVPHAPGDSASVRLARTLKTALTKPAKTLRAYTTRKWPESTTILLYMRSLEGTMSFRRSGLGGMKTVLSNTEPPTANMPEAEGIARRFADKTGGLGMVAFPETAFNVPTTAHILGGACIGKDAYEGVIDDKHQVWNYPGLMVCDGSAVSANPGVNPSLTITAMSERAMGFVAPKPGPA